MPEPASGWPDHPYGWLSLAPPLATVLLAIVTRRAVASLLAGLMVGALILSAGRPVEACVRLLETHLWPTLVDPWQVRLFGFLVLIGAMIGVVNRSGGMQGLVGIIVPLAKTRRRGQLATWLAGLLVFFDDYTNTLLVGATMRSTCDRLRVSREKLAYIVDSTAAPVAGIALLSTWVAVEIDFLQKGLDACGADLVGEYNAVGLFLGCLPYRFYIIQALLFVPILAALGRDFGPMLHAERSARRDRNDGESGGSPPPAGDHKLGVAPTHWSNAILPLGATLAVVIGLIVQTGRSAWAADNPGVAPSWQDLFGAAEANVALFYGALVGLGVAMAVSLGRGLLSHAEAGNAAFAGVRAVLPGMMILWLAGTMSGMTRDGGERVTADAGYQHADVALYTGDYLQSLLPLGDSSASARAVALSLPTVTFLTAAVVAFSTGTSFGTMGILFPVVAPVAFAALGPTAGAPFSEPLLLATFGAVLSGAIFGDHCSPISDTTVLSSQSSGCDHIAHVVTQMPYALVVAAVTILFGTAPLAAGVSVWLLLPLQTTALVAIVLRFGKRVDAETPVEGP
ncbi:MAG: Na+/H+ antiporter NhaC family protein [Planctomycetota bacterium]